jgi:hypothetical protein
VVLTGTGNIDHLHENVAFINREPLQEDIQSRLKDLFGNVDCIAGD